VEGAPALTTYDPKTLDERNVRVEKFIVLGLKNKPKSVKVEGTGEELVWDYIPGAGSAEKKGGMASTLIIKDPKLKITSDWSVVIS
jgi:alpha 1,3-glucosidase